MKITKLYVFMAALLVGCGHSGNIEVGDMRCEYMPSPIGIDLSVNPRFTWSYSSENSNEGFVQQSAEVLLAVDKQALMTMPDFSFSVEGDRAFVESKRESFSAHTKYYWRVRAVGINGEEIFSRVDSLTTAIDGIEGWNAQWISDSYDKDEHSAPMFLKEFNVRGGVASAELSMSAAGYAVMTLNGQKVTPNSLEPGYTHYDKRNLYTTYDVTDLLLQGKSNEMGAVLGNGFYNAYEKVAVWEFETARWRNRPRFTAELRINYNDGEQETIITDQSWKTAIGPFVCNNIYSGDIYDARKEDSVMVWENATVVDAPSAVMTAQNFPAITTTDVLEPLTVQNFGDSVYVYDFGVNFTGVCTLNIEGGEAGVRVDMQHGELLKDSGRIQMGNLDIYFFPKENFQFQTDSYILSGKGQESFTPYFTYHGFRYVEVRVSSPMKLTKESLVAKNIHSDVKSVGDFSCSNELLNKIWEATRRSYLSNLHSIPTDCPQREKNGWTADAHISMDLGLLNYDGIGLYEKWMNDFCDNQLPDGSVSGIVPSAGWGYGTWVGPVWDAAMFVVPNKLYNYYGDSRAIERVWTLCQRYLDYLATLENENGILTHGLGDWVPYSTQTPSDFTSTCFYYQDYCLMARFARILREDDTKYVEKAKALKTTINELFYDSEKAIYANGSQSALSVALALGVVPEVDEQRVADNLDRSVEASGNHLDFGVLGSQYVPRMLAKYGYVERAYAMATQTSEPSWGAWIEKGYTTLPETWLLSKEFRDASLNHVFLGDISAWMVNVLAGINYDEECVGFEGVIIEPHFVEGLDWVKASYRSVRGDVKVEWKRSDESSEIELVVEVPLNSTAKLIIDGAEEELSSGIHVKQIKRK